MMLKLKLQYFGHLMQRVDSLEKILMLGGIGGRRRRGQQRMRWLDGITARWTWVSVNSGSWWWTGRPGMLRFMGSQRVGHDWAIELNWTELTLPVEFFIQCQMIIVNFHFLVDVLSSLRILLCHVPTDWLQKRQNSNQPVLLQITVLVKWEV